jgi:hypothetical protein
MSHQLNSHFFSIWRGGSVRGVEQSKKKVILFPIFSLVKLFFSHINHPANTVVLPGVRSSTDRHPSAMSTNEPVGKYLVIFRSHPTTTVASFRAYR